MGEQLQEQLMERSPYIRKIENDHARSWHRLEELLSEQATKTQEQFASLEQAITRVAKDFTKTQAGGCMSVSQCEDAPPMLRASDLPGFRALQDFTREMERSGSSSKKNLSKSVNAVEQL